LLGGLAPFSTVDFPGRLAAVLFAQGCPLACRYCHNPHLRPRHTPAARPWADVMAWLSKRRGLLDAVVVSGGEPTIQRGLTGALLALRELGFATGLHTAGTNPGRLEQALPWLDWVGLDIKAPFDRYAAVTGRGACGPRAYESLDRLLARGMACEVRTTVHGSLLGADDLIAIARALCARGVRRWVLQTFRPAGCRDAALLADPSPLPLATLVPALADFVPDIVLR
jgi:anaerobic ribonucleoside-triphosphate reductase activating protein